MAKMNKNQQIKEIEKNVKNIRCPIILSEVNKKYRELKEGVKN